MQSPEQTRLFICPLCGGRVYARKSGYNGHVYAQCCVAKQEYASDSDQVMRRKTAVPLSQNA